MIWWQAVILFNGGVLVAGLCIVAGAWIMFKATRQPGSGESFLASPKGEVFNIANEGDDYDNNGEPTVDEKAIMKQTNRFLKVLGGA